MAGVEGVTALFNSRLRTSIDALEAWAFSIPHPTQQAFQEATISAAVLSMLLEGETRRMLGAMAQADISGLLLKGQAIAQWAYPDPSLRASGDIDVLVATREAADRLARSLCDSGYELFQPSGDLVALEMMLRREVAPGLWVEIDLHCRVINSPLFSERFTFDELMAESIALPRLGANALGLGPAHAFIHACMHWAATLAVGAEIRLKWVYDIPAFARVFSPADWQRLQQLAVERGLAGVCLSMIEASQATFGADFVAVPDDLIAALREAARHESPRCHPPARLALHADAGLSRPAHHAPSCPLPLATSVAQPRLHGVSVWAAGSGLLGPDRHPGAHGGAAIAGAEGKRLSSRCSP
ncbi:MAG: nucleotidyltransferase family protein [Comamonadaceae bacterium]|nr:nucleotidyltransferase family protein [Comamonadaceae bacterium]